MDKITIQTLTSLVKENKTIHTSHKTKNLKNNKIGISEGLAQIYVNPLLIKGLYRARSSRWLVSRLKEDGFKRII